MRVILNGWPAGLSELPIELLVVVVIPAGLASIFFLRHPRSLRAANFSEMRTKQCRFCRCCLAVYCKGVVSFFFVKILINRGWCTRMHLLYKMRIKGRFAQI